MELFGPGTPPPCTDAMTRRLVVAMLFRSISTCAMRVANCGSWLKGLPFLCTRLAITLSFSSAAIEKPTPAMPVRS